MEDIDNQIKNNPLSKEEAREQFIKQTEKLGLKHAFSFDEAWEIGQELRKRQEYREKVVEVQKQLEQTEGALTGEELHAYNPTKSTFAGGCYIREIFNPAGQIIVTKIHKKEHPFFLLVGEMSILKEEGIEHIKAPYYGVTKAGTKRVIYTHTDCIFVTVHATDKTTVEDVEEEVIAKDFTDPDVSLDEIEKLLNQINQ